MRKDMIVFGILCVFCLVYSVHADYTSSTFGGSVTVFGLYPPTMSNPPAWTNTTGVSITDKTWNITIDARTDFMNWTIVTSPDIGSAGDNEVQNGSKTVELSGLQYSTNYTIYVNATSIDIELGGDRGCADTNQTFWFETRGCGYTSSTFGGEIEVLADPIIIDVAPTIWTAGNINVNTDIQNNFTLWQNGSANIDITIGLNATNFSLVNYATWDGAGHNQITANFTDNNWASETNMNDVSYPFTNTLKTDYAPGNFNFGIRIWLPKSLDAESVNEDFEVVVSVSEHT